MKTKYVEKNLGKSYAIFVRSSYGDLLMVDPLIKYIKSLNKNNKISLFVEEKNAQIVEFMEYIDNLCVMPSKGNKYLFYIYYGLKYRQNKYDISIAAKTGVGSANGFFQFILGAKKQISYISKDRTWTDKLINTPIIYNESIYNNQHYALSILRLLNKKIEQVPVSLYPKLDVQIKKPTNIKKKLLISVSNNRESCLLNNKSIASIINDLSKEFDFYIYISAVENDYDLAVNLKNNISRQSKICVTPLLREYIFLLNSMDLCFFGEGGSMHMAAALGIPQVVLFGETSSITWSPLSQLAEVITDNSNVNNIPNSIILQALKNKLQILIL
jgi:ADP-heptose:LPS heptosyltransferase